MQCLFILQEQNSGSFILLYIKTLCKAMVIDFLMFTSRPSAKQWSLIYLCSRPSTTQWSLISLCLHQDPLQSNGHGFLIIEALCEAMIIDLFTSRPSARQWSLISYVTSRPSAKQWSWFFSTSRPSARQWSSISLHQDPLQGNGHWFLMSHRGPLRGNGHQSLYIKTLCEAMVIDFFCQIVTLYMVMVTESLNRPSPRKWANLFFFFSKK